jgi:hypothetical protein
MPKKTCFVISPIGDEGSEVRQHADDVFELLLGPALEPFDFDLVRANRIPGSGVITTQIIELVQSCELCVIDLSTHNANVYYECGRRHETGRPYVQLIRRGERIPFDLAGIRTITYDVSTPRGVYEASQTLRRYVAEHVKSGFQAAQTGASLATLASGFERLERKLDRLAGAGPVTPTLPGLTESYADQFSKNPSMALAEALAVRNFDYAAKLLPVVEQRDGFDEQVVIAAAILAGEGAPAAGDVLARFLDSPLDACDVDQLRTAVSGYVTYLNQTDSEAEGLPLLRDLIPRLITERATDPGSEAYLLNQLQRAVSGVATDGPNGPLSQEVLALSVRVTELRQDVVAYWYNLALNYERCELLDLALSAVDRYMALGNDSPEELTAAHLFQAVDLYVKHGRDADAREAYERLASVALPRARLMLANPAVARAVGQTLSL